QALCAVCAVSYDDVRAIAGRLASKPDVISLDPKRLGQVLDDLVTLADACGERARGVELRARLGGRLDRLREAVSEADRQRVLALEWLDPPYVGGHWVPEMIEIAGGRDTLGTAGEKSRTADWDEISGSGAQVVVAMPCGWDAERAVAEVESRAARVAAIGADRI